MKRLSEIKVLPILESLKYIKHNHASVVRFGDGEIDLMTGHSIPYQDYNEKLAKRLQQILQTKVMKNYWFVSLMFFQIWIVTIKMLVTFGSDIF